MRKIVVLEFMTLDGVIQAPGGSKEDQAGGFKYGGWMGPFFDDFGGKEMAKQMSGKYDLLLGRRTYDIFAGYWPEHSEEWSQVNKITKYVVSKTLKNPSWENTVVLKDIKAVQKLKNLPAGRQGTSGPPLQVYGSSKLIQALIKHDLVDEYWLKIFPITLGQGKKLFGEGTIPASFKLTDGKISPKGVIFAKYKRAGKVKTQDVGGDSAH